MAPNPADDGCHTRAQHWPRRNGHAAVTDLSVVAAVVSLFFTIAAHLELAERLSAWASHYEHWQLDELPLTLLVLSLGLAWFGWRRWRELRDEIATRCRVEEMNLHMLARNRQLAQQVIELQEQERRHLARELHDEIGQCCVAIKTDAALIRRDTHDTESRIDASAKAIIDTAEHMHDVLRGMLQRLRPTGLDDFGLVACLQVLVESWSQRHRFTCTFHAEGALEDLGEATNITLYRAVQESLSNVAQHAQASHASVSISRSSSPDDNANTLTLRVDDNGVGSATGDARHGLGVIGMQERVRALGGCAALMPAPTGGTRVQVVLPLPSAGAAA
jgi:two-component system, NarL family, sensor histidine kinase UhpB